MKFVKNRVLSFFCALSILVSLMVPVASAEGIGVDENLDTDSVSAWQSAVGNDVTDFVDEFASFFGCSSHKIRCLLADDGWYFRFPSWRNGP